MPVRVKSVRIRPVKVFISFLWVVCSLTISGKAIGQGFAGLGKNVEGYKEVKPGKEFSFPADHAAHDGYRIEWWYVTANLKDEEGRSFGVQWTLFRSALVPPIIYDEQDEGNKSAWASPTIWMGHSAVTSKDHHYSAERFARGETGQAGVDIGDDKERFAAWIDNWQLAQTKTEKANINGLTVSAGDEKFSYSLSLKTDNPLVLQGENGYSQKSDNGQASYYYSQPFFNANGVITLEGKPYTVEGKAWMDREWSSQLLSPEQEGWDWFSLHLDSEEKIMLFRLRDKDGTAFYSGAWINSQGHLTLIERDQITFKEQKYTRMNGKKIPTHWRLKIKDRGFDISTSPLNKKSWMHTSFPYWEGPINFKGSHNGIGYLEMTGYE